MFLQRCFYFLVLATIQILFLSSVISTTSSPSTSSSTPTTEFPISQVAYWSTADDCVRSCATAATSQYANSLSCSSSNPIPCICQTPIDPANLARLCALSSCSAPATDLDIVGIDGKEIILEWCSSNQYSTSAPNAVAQTTGPLSITATLTATYPSTLTTPLTPSPTTSPTTGSGTGTGVSANQTSSQTSSAAVATTSVASGTGTGTGVSANQSSSQTSSAAVATTSVASGLSPGGKIGIGVAVAVVLIAAIIGGLLLWRKRRQGGTPRVPMDNLENGRRQGGTHQVSNEALVPMDNFETGPHLL